MYTAVLFTVTTRWEQPKCPLTDERINKMWSVHTMKSFSALKYILTHATIWMDLKDIMLSEVSQLQKTKQNCMIPLI